MKDTIYDLCIVGGGINGASIARDAAGRGYKVLLLEQNDFASATSSKSTKLVHGGLRYLEHFEFGLVRKALNEREVLLNLAPHIIWPMRFVLPHAPHLRPMWMIRLGLFLYDNIASSITLKKSSKTKINNDVLNKNFNKGVEYSDCWVEDSRLVILNVMDAKLRGATVLNNTKCTGIQKQDDLWAVQTDNGQFQCQMIINAAGPWASDIIENVPDLNDRPLRLVKGSHIIVPKLYNGDEAYILQNDDKRVVFSIPYENDYTLIGTTDVDVGHNPDQEIKIDHNEIKYLIDVINKHFNSQIKQTDIVETYSGVRPLLDEGGDASKITRDYKLDLQVIDNNSFLSVLGGKITTCRALAQEAVDMVDGVFHKTPHHWTSDEKLPGGDLPDNDFDRFVNEQASEFPFLSRALIKRYARAYGTCMNILMDGVHTLDDMGRDIGGGVYGRELDYLIAYEFARTGDDVLKRRSKLYLHLDKATQKAVDDYMIEKMT
jgi:glycerol-3-phosphate dehydrogenase